MFAMIEGAMSKMMVTQLIENRPPVQEPLIVMDEDRKRRLEQDCDRISKRLHKSNSSTK